VHELLQWLGWLACSLFMLHLLAILFYTLPPDIVSLAS
jgi:hypothetical protein